MGRRTSRCRGMGTEIGAVLCLGGREQPRFYSVCDPAVINISSSARPAPRLRPSP